MSSVEFLIGVALLFLGGLIGAIMWNWRRSAAARSEFSQYPQLVRLDRVTLALRYVGVCLGLVCIPVGSVFVHDGQFYDLIPAVMGSLVVICSTVGELVMFDKARQVGVASLEPRRVGAWLPARLLVLAGIALAVFVCLLVGAWSVADPTGWSFSLNAFYQGKTLCSMAVWPFFGLSYSVPLLLATGIFLVLSGIGGWVVVRRPRNGADPVLAEWDDALRRRSLRGLTATVCGVLSADVLMVAWSTADGLGLVRQIRQCDGVPASGVVIDKNLLWYSWPGWEVVMWVVVAASFIGCIAAAAIVLGSATPTRSAKEMR